MLNRVGLGSAADAGTFRMGLGLVNVLFSRSVSSYARSQLGARKKIQRNLWPKKEAALKIIWENRKLTRARVCLFVCLFVCSLSREVCASDECKARLDGCSIRKETL